MLHLIDGGIADPHRTVAAIALQIGRGALVDRGRRHHAVERPQLLVRLAAIDSVNEMNSSIVRVAPIRLSAWTTK